jgi:cytochrome P450
MNTSPAFPPGPKLTLNIGFFGIFRQNPMRFFFQMAQYGDISHINMAGTHVYMLNHPDLIRDVLVTQAKSFHKSRGLRNARIILGNGLLTSEDDFHKRQRRLAAPAFHAKKIGGYAETMVRYAAQTAERWQAGQTVDMAHEMMRLTLAVAGKTLFDADVEGEADEIREALTESMSMFLRTNSAIYPILKKLPLPSNRRFIQSQQRLDQTVYRMIAEHRLNPSHDDLLGMMLAAQDDEDDQGQMSDLQLRDEAMTIFLAGHETTAIATTWTWYLLAKHPEVADQLHAELRRVLNGRLPTYEDVPKLAYTRQVLAEAMRLYPPAYVVGREPVVEVEVGGYRIPPKSSIFMSQYVMQRDPRYFTDPEKFDPLRWTPEAEASRPKFSYFPFGGGPRVCIGEMFAWTEGILVLATLGQCWQPQLAVDREIGLHPMITLRPQGGVPMRLERIS